MLYIKCIHFILTFPADLYIKYLYILWMIAVLEIECITYQYKVCNAYFVFTDIMYNNSKYKVPFILTLCNIIKYGST